MAQDLLNRQPVDIWPCEGHPENHGAAPPGLTLSPGKLRQGWRDSLGTELQEAQAVPFPDTAQPSKAAGSEPALPGLSATPCCLCGSELL